MKLVRIAIALAEFIQGASYCNADPAPSCGDFSGNRRNANALMGPLFLSPFFGIYPPPLLESRCLVKVCPSKLYLWSRMTRISAS
jgi:hypothetical protein